MVSLYEGGKTSSHGYSCLGSRSARSNEILALGPLLWQMYLQPGPRRLPSAPGRERRPGAPQRRAGSKTGAWKRQGPREMPRTAAAGLRRGPGRRQSPERRQRHRLMQRATQRAQVPCGSLSGQDCQRRPPPGVSRAFCCTGWLASPFAGCTGCGAVWVVRLLACDTFVSSFPCTGEKTNLKRSEKQKF